MYHSVVPSKAIILVFTRNMKEDPIAYLVSSNTGAFYNNKFIIFEAMKRK